VFGLSTEDEHEMTGETGSKHRQEQGYTHIGVGERIEHAIASAERTRVRVIRHLPKPIQTTMSDVASSDRTPLIRVLRPELLSCHLYSSSVLLVLAFPTKGSIFALLFFCWARDIRISACAMWEDQTMTS
jgi:hypothetical protein